MTLNDILTMHLNEILLAILILVTLWLGYCFRYSKEIERLEHSKDLHGILERWRREFPVPSASMVHIYEIPDSRMAVYQNSTWYYEPERGFYFQLENDILFKDLLKNHLPKRFFFYSPLARKWKEYGEIANSYLWKCHDLYREISDECVETTGFPVREWGEVGIINGRFCESVYDQRIYRAVGSSEAGGEYEIRTEEDAVELRLGPSGIARGNEEQMTHCQEIHRNLLSGHDLDERCSERIGEIVEAKRKLDSLGTEIEGIIEKLLKKKILPGRCGL